MSERCNWVHTDADAHYHDTEWGRPSHDERYLFEMLILEGAQAGLSWSTILHKRGGYRAAFANFEVDEVARFTPARLEKLLLNPGIVRHRDKIESVVTNARAVQRIRAEHGSLAAFLWSFVDSRPRLNGWDSYRDAPASTEISDVLSKALKRHGCKFVGSTICYALMQAIGMVNDHEFGCPCRDECAKFGTAPDKPTSPAKRAATKPAEAKPAAKAKPATAKRAATKKASA